MFDALRARIRSLKDAPQRARDLAAQRLTARCRTGHVEPTGEGLRAIVRVRRPFVSPAWSAIIRQSIADALGEGER